MENLKLDATRREILGKGVRALRRQGFVPARVYGPHTAPLPVQIEAQAFRRVLAKAGSLSLVTLAVDGEQHTVLIREVQRAATTGATLHADLYAVTMTERLRASVPVAFVGESAAVRTGGVLLRSVDTIEVECLPADLPHEIVADVSKLTEIEASLHVRDLAAPKGVTILTPADELIAKVAAPTVEVEEVVAPVAPAPQAEVGRVEQPAKEEGEEAEAAG